MDILHLVFQLHANSALEENGNIYEPVYIYAYRSYKQAVTYALHTYIPLRHTIHRTKKRYKLLIKAN